MYTKYFLAGQSTQSPFRIGRPIQCDLFAASDQNVPPNSISRLPLVHGTLYFIHLLGELFGQTELGWGRLAPCTVFLGIRRDARGERRSENGGGMILLVVDVGVWDWKRGGEPPKARTISSRIEMNDATDDNKQNSIIWNMTNFTQRKKHVVRGRIHVAHPFSH